ncbi:hypothetical protein PRIPAC_92591, partial [Pristionchus pacificus]|uniref:Protein kinase domain-containing protein n=1 Tax=Pristionchus pacificus TaxID=54126 RepID=A0A2A6BP95_PRIPA
ITPEKIESTIVKFLKFRNEIVETISEFYGDEIMNQSFFFETISDKYYEVAEMKLSRVHCNDCQNDLPMLDIQYEAMRSIFTSMVNAWSITVSKTEEVIKNELDYLRTQCTPQMSSKDFHVLFDLKNDPDWKEYVHVMEIILNIKIRNLKVTCSRLLNRSQLATHYKEKLRLEVQEKYNDHIKIRNENIIVEKGVENYFVSGEEIVTKETTNDARNNELDSSFDRNSREYTTFLELKRTTFIEFFESSVNMKSQLNMKADSLSDYRKNEREEIRKLYHEDLTNSEKNVLQGTDNKLPNIELSEFEQTKKEIGRGGEVNDVDNLLASRVRNTGRRLFISRDLSPIRVAKECGRVFRYQIPGHLIGFNSVLVNIAVKKFEVSSPQSSSKTPSMGVTGNEEVLALFKLRHPNIVQFIGTGTLNDERHLILEYCPKTLAGVIDDCLASNHFIIPTDFTNWASGIANGLRFVHENRHFHGDLKPANILIDSNGVAKLADFGLSAIPISRRCTISCRNRGTVRYMAPEQHTGEQLDLEGLKRCDVWAFGIVLWEMVTCRKPFSGIQDHAIPLVIGAKDEKSHPVLPNECSCEYLINLLRRCWCSKAIERPSSYSIATVFMRNLIFDFEDVFNHGDQWKEECERWTRASEE